VEKVEHLLRRGYQLRVFHKDDQFQISLLNEGKGIYCGAKALRGALEYLNRIMSDPLEQKKA